MVADALSRSSDTLPGSLFLLSMTNFLFLTELKQKLSSNGDFIKLRYTIQASPVAYPDYFLTQDFIMYKGLIWLPPGVSFIAALLTKFHHSPIGGHMGVHKTLARLEDNFTWSTIRKDTRKFINSCLDCQHTKYETQKLSGLLCPLPIPAQPWEDLSMDIIVGLPTYRGHANILVVVDKFSKGLHFGMLPTHHTAHSVALFFMEIVGKLYGMPKSIISDRDPLFISKFWQ